MPKAATDSDLAGKEVVRPQAGPQTMFLQSPADIVIYGGSAGGGKTWALLLETLRHVDNTGFDFVVFRRTSPQITAPGGLWDAAAEFYPKVGAQANQTTLTYKFPSGAKGKFAHLQYESNVFDWQGAEIALICFDELTHFSSKQFFYMLSRNRSTCGVKPYIRATTNPGPGWVKEFLAAWVDPQHPNPALSGEIRYFTRIKGEVVWVDEGWTDEAGDPPKSVTFIKSTVYDNQALLAKDPGYIVNLKSLDEVERARLLDGDWNVFEGAFFSEWSEARHVTTPPVVKAGTSPVPAWWRWFGGLDYGKAAPFCFLLCASDDAGNVTVVDEIYERMLQPSEQAQKMLEVLERNGVDSRHCPIWADPSIFPPQDEGARRGHPGKYIAEEYWGEGLDVVKANNDRQNGWARMREYLHEPGALRVFRGRCPNLIRTIPIQTYDTHAGNGEDLDTTGEDHACDAARYALMSRPARAKAPVDPYAETPLPRVKVDNRPLFLKRTQGHYA